MITLTDKINSIAPYIVDTSITTGINEPDVDVWNTDSSDKFVTMRVGKGVVRLSLDQADELAKLLQDAALALRIKKQKLG
jgi:hypothetical protein